MTWSRIAGYSVMWVVASVIHLAFITSLPYPWNLTPLMLACGILLIHYSYWKEGLLWLIGFGVLVSWVGLSRSFFEPCIYLITGLGVFLATKQLFSKQSLFSTLANAVVGWSIYSAALSCFLLIESLFRQTRSISLTGIFFELLWILVLLCLTLLLFHLLRYVLITLWHRYW